MSILPDFEPVAAVDSGGYEPDLEAALQRVLRLMAIPGKSGEEGAIAAAVVRELRDAGLPSDLIQFDRVHELTPLKGHRET